MHHISVLECRIRGSNQVQRLEFPTQGQMQEFVDSHRRIEEPSKFNSDGRPIAWKLIQPGIWDYAIQSHYIIED